MPMRSVDPADGRVEQAKAATGERTARGAVTVALQQVVASSRQERALDAIEGMSFLGDLLRDDVAGRSRH